ncbi:hypothetical protein pb186bvf_002090 [Paramecium bursaria]
MIQRDFCQVQGHNSKQIIGICESKSCIQPSRKVCLKCIQVHEKSDSNFKSDDIKDEFDIQVILDQFKQTNIGMLDNIQLQCQIQQYLLYQELMDLIKNISFKQDYLSGILDQLDEFKSNTWSNISSDYLLNNDNRGINNYQQKVFDKIIEIKDYTDFYLINIAMHQYSIIDDKYSNLDNNIFQLFKNIENKKVKLFDSIIKSKNQIIIDQQFIQKQRNENPIITLCEILLDQGQQLDINDMFLQFEKLKYSLLEKVDSHKVLYIDSYAKLFNQDSDKYLSSVFDIVEQLDPSESKPQYLKGRQQLFSQICILIIKGMLLIDSNQYDQALLCFENAISIDNLFCDAYNQKGQNCSIYEESIEAYNKAIKIDPNNEIYYYNKGCLQFNNLIGNSYHNLTRYQEAIEMYNLAILLNPYDDIYYFDKGNSFYCLERYWDALDMYDMAIKFDPNYDKYYFNKGFKCLILKGKSYHKLQKYSLAIQMFDEAIEIQPHLDQYYNYKGDSLFEQNNYKKALDMYSKAIEIEPNCDFYFKNKGFFYNIKLGKAQHFLNRFEEAIANYNLSLELNEYDSQTYFYKGNSFHQLKKYNEAIYMYDMAIELNNQCEIYHIYKGNSLYCQQKYKVALICYEEAIELNPNNHIAYGNKANTLYQLENYTDANTIYDKAIILSPLNFDYYYENGQVLDQLKRFPEAIIMYTKAIKLNPKSEKLYINKGISLYKSKQYQESIEMYDQAMKINPLNHKLFFEKGKLYLRIKKGNSLFSLNLYEQSLILYTEAVDLDPLNSRYIMQQGEYLIIFKDNHSIIQKDIRKLQHILRKRYYSIKKMMKFIIIKVLNNIYIRKYFLLAVKILGSIKYVQESHRAKSQRGYLLLQLSKHTSLLEEILGCNKII